MKYNRSTPLGDGKDEVPCEFDKSEWRVYSRNLIKKLQKRGFFPYTIEKNYLSQTAKAGNSQKSGRKPLARLANAIINSGLYPEFSVDEFFLMSGFAPVTYEGFENALADARRRVQYPPPEKTAEEILGPEEDDSWLAK